MVRLSAQQARVTFVIRCRTDYGQRVRLVGDHASLGGWDPLRGIELTTSFVDYPTWRISLTLPAGRRFRYKYVCMSTQDPLAEGHDTITQSINNVNLNSKEQSLQLEQSNQNTSKRRPDSFEHFDDGRQDDNVRMDSMLDLMQNVKVDYWECFDGNRYIETIGGCTMNVDEGTFGLLNNENPGRIRTESHLPSITSDSDQQISGIMSGTTSPVSVGSDSDNVIIALYRLPIIAKKDPTTDKWDLQWDDDALYLTSTGLRRGLAEMKKKPLWVGILDTQDTITSQERPQLTQRLMEEFNCVPVFFSEDILNKFYQGFCKGIIWPTFHTILSLHSSDGKTRRFDRETWHAYQRVNRTFSNVIVEHYERHLIWVHDYHLMMLPYYLRIKLSGVKIGFFMHIPWPSSEVFRTLPFRNELLKGLLSSTILGFHLFDYARHFLSGCVRLLNLEHQAKGGSLGIEFEGRHVTIRVSHIGVDPYRFNNSVGRAIVRQRVTELESKYHGKILLGAIDDLDVIKGISLKLIAFEHYLESCVSQLQQKVALIQVAIPKTARVDSNVRNEIHELVQGINERFGTPDHQPVTYIEESISFDERVAIYSVSDALFLTPVRDGLNLIPYEYIISSTNSTGQLILSEFTGCSRALSSAVRVNPWNVVELRDAIDNVIQTRQKYESEIRLKHEADHRYVMMHSSATWARSFLVELEDCQESSREVVRLGLSRRRGFKRLEDDDFTLLSQSTVLKAYRETKKKLFLFDYDGTLTQIESQGTHMAHSWALPTEDVRRNLELLAKQEGNTVIILSGRKKDTEGFHQAPMIPLGIAAEHGFYYKRPGSSEWEEIAQNADLSWMELVLGVMKLYTERTDGSYIEEKRAGVVWHYLAADPEFGGWQAKEMHDHLESILTNFNVEVISGQGWLQVRMSNVNKGTMVARILKDLGERPDFILCCGDDRTDEDMFDVLSKDAASSNGHVFTATVGVKPSNARFYLRSPIDVAQIIEGAVEISLPTSRTHVRSSTLEDMRPAALRGIPGANRSISSSSSSSALNLVAQEHLNQ